MAGKKNRPEFISIKDAANLLDITTRHVQRLAKTGRLPGCHRDGKNWRIPRSVIIKKPLGLMQSIRAIRDDLCNVADFCQGIISKIDRLIDIEIDRRNAKKTSPGDKTKS